MKEFRFRWLVLPFAICLFFGFSSPVSAGNGGNGNGFPSGDHYNLNLIAKKSDPAAPGFFTCPTADDYKWDYYSGDGCELIDGVPNEYCEKCNLDNVSDCPVKGPSEQNVIFVPRDGTTDVTGDEKAEEISIIMKSGAARPGKKAVLATSLKVTDWCTEHFGGTPAVFELPENTGGYRVYARVTGKPMEGTAWTFTSPSIENVQDEYGNELYWLGTIGGPNGCTDANGNVLLERIEPNKKGGGKGVRQATDLSCLFNFSGDVCYVNDLCYYCEAVDENNQPIYTCDAPDPLWIDPDFVCCQNQIDKNLNIIVDSCGEAANFNCVPPAWTCLTPDPENGCVDGVYGEWGWVCPETRPLEIALQCHNYPAGTWVFDIADFVDVLWKSKTSGAYVVQLRFYPN